MELQPDWIAGLFGGLLIGLAAVCLLLINGRVMGASGILGGLVDGSGSSDRAERLWFVGGLIGVPMLAVTFFMDAETHLTDNSLLIISAGLCVGLGTRLANGCTSGHGVCGISRLSRRGIVATVIYIAAGAVTVALLRQLWGLL